MKRRIIMSTFVLLIGMSNVFAHQGGDVTEKALTSFQKDFKNATDVSWQNAGQFLKVSFSVNEQMFIAYYNEQGERLAIARNLRSLDLPMGLQADLKETYSNFWITDLFEIQTNEETAYYMTVETADYKITLKSSGLTEWVTYKKSEKK